MSGRKRWRVFDEFFTAIAIYVRNGRRSVGKMRIDAAPSVRVVFGLPLRTATTYAVLFIVAICVYTKLWPNVPVMDGDSPGYLAAAQDLSDGSVDRLNDRSPGFPVLLIITGSSQTPSRELWFVSLSLYLATIWMLAGVLYAAGLRGKAIIVFGLLLLLPPYVENAGYVLTENLAQFCLVIGLAGLVLWLSSQRRAWLIISAVAIGYSALTRPSYQALAFVIAGCLFLLPWLFPKGQFQRKAMAKTGAVLVITSCTMIGGYSLVNHRKFGYFGVTPLLGFNLSTKTMPFVEKLPEPYANVREILVEARDKQLVKPGSSHTGSQSIWSARSRLQETTGLSTAELSKYMLHLNLLLIRRAPLNYLREVTRALSTYWMPAGKQLSSMNSALFQMLWVALHFVVLGLFGLQLLALGGNALFDFGGRVISRDRPVLHRIHVSRSGLVAYVFSIVLIFYTMLITCLVAEGDPRQRATDAFLIFVVVLGFHIWRLSLKRLSNPRNVVNDPIAQSKVAPVRF